MCVCVSMCDVKVCTFVRIHAHMSACVSICTKVLAVESVEHLIT
jgi:hypothetical protein